MMPVLKKILRKSYPSILWTSMIIILLCLPGSMLPEEKGFDIVGFDKFVHFTLFGVFVYLWCFYFYSKEMPIKKTLIIYFIVFLLAEALGIGLEYVQKYYIPNRDFELGDIIADMMGAGIAYGICNIKLIKKMEWPNNGTSPL
jgi:hypothetical protein